MRDSLRHPTNSLSLARQHLRCAHSCQPCSKQPAVRRSSARRSTAQQNRQRIAIARRKAAAQSFTHDYSSPPRPVLQRCAPPLLIYLTLLALKRLFKRQHWVLLIVIVSTECIRICFSSTRQHIPRTAHSTARRFAYSPAVSIGV